MAMPQFPIKSIVKPADLANVQNGMIPANLLVDLGKRGCKMHHLAARGFRYIVAKMAEAGYVWDVVSIDPRTFDQQWRIFDRRAWPSTGRYLPEEMWAAHERSGGKWGKRDNGSIQEYTWTAPGRTKAERWRRVSPFAMAAVPGTSPHGWALAVDLALQLDDDPEAEGITEAAVRFLINSGTALDAGFAWSTQSEPWHLQWFGGSTVPPKVLAWERGNQAPPEPPPVTPVTPPTYTSREDEMIIVDYGFPVVNSWWTRCVITGGKLLWVQGHAQEWREPDDPRTPVNEAKVRTLDELASGHIQVQDDAHFIHLLSTYGTDSLCPTTFVGNLTLMNCWGWSFARTHGYFGSFEQWTRERGLG